VIKAKARRMYRTLGVRLFVVDYIQLLRSGSRRFREDRVQELAEISGELQALGKELDTPIIVLAQMNRDYEKEPNRSPRLSDLKDCGAIEQDADVVVFLHAPKLTSDEDDLTETQLTKVYGKEWCKRIRVNALVAKNRFGPTGPAKLLMHQSYLKFQDWTEWQKQHGFREAAKGERQPEMPAQEDMPPWKPS
jgi:replicative DNA helicase